MKKKNLLIIVSVLAFTFMLYAMWLKVKKSTEYLRGNLNAVTGTNQFITQSWCQFVLDSTPTNTQNGYNEFYETCLLAKDAQWTEQQFLDAWADGDPSEFNNL